MNVLITFTTIGVDAGPFNLYSNVDGFVSAFDTGVTRTQLLAGFPTMNVPVGTTIIRARSVGVCSNYYDMVVPPQLCFKFLPADSTYILSQIFHPTSTFTYGAFTGYEESGIITASSDLIKLNIDLTIDTSFNVNVGFNETLYTGSTIIEQPDGKLLVSGTFTTYQGVNANRIIRLNPDGTRDLTFVIGTGFDNFTQKLSLDGSGRIVVPGIFNAYNGTSSPRIARLLTNGSIDPSFIVGTGFNNTTLSALANDDDSIIVSGYFSTYKGVACGNGITKLDSSGTVDPTFNVGAGFLPYVPNNANYIAKPDGQYFLYAAGAFTSYKGVAEPHIIKINKFGAKDVSFNAGTGFNASPYSIQIVWGDKIFVQGTFTTYNGINANGFIILNPDGTVYYTPSTVLYYTPIIIGNILFGQQVGACLEILFTQSTPSTTTTTTTLPLIYYEYDPNFTTCNTCASLFAIGNRITAAPVTVGKWYYDTLTNYRINILSFVGMSAGPINSNLINQQDTCAAVICPTTTTTTTI